MEQDLLEIIDAAIESRGAITLERPEMPEPELLCIPIKRSENLLLAHVFYDFSPDGYSIIRLDDVYDVLRDGGEMFFERIIKAEGVYKDLAPPEEIDLASWKTALGSMKGRRDYCILEIDDEEDFLIGKLMEVSDWDFTFWYFDAAGKWDDELDVIDYDDLISVSFGDRYTNTIIKYIPLP